MINQFWLLIVRTTLCLNLLSIAYFAVVSGGPIVNGDTNDKTAHIGAFYMSGLLADFAFPRSYFGLKKILPLLGYGLLIEIVQSFIPYRDACILDLLADASGLALYALTFLILMRTPFIGWRWTTVRD
jgi:VanZ family protein